MEQKDSSPHSDLEEGEIIETPEPSASHKHDASSGSSSVVEYVPSNRTNSRKRRFHETDPHNHRQHRAPQSKRMKVSPTVIEDPETDNIYYYTADTPMSSRSCSPSRRRWIRLSNSKRRRRGGKARNRNRRQNRRTTRPRPLSSSPREKRIIDLTTFKLSISLILPFFYDKSPLISL